MAFIEYMTDVAMIMGATNRTLTKEMMTHVYRFEKQLAKVRLRKMINIYNSSIYQIVLDSTCVGIRSFSKLLLIHG